MRNTTTVSLQHVYDEMILCSSKELWFTFKSNNFQHHRRLFNNLRPSSSVGINFTEATKKTAMINKKRQQTTPEDCTSKML